MDWTILLVIGAFALIIYLKNTNVFVHNLFKNPVFKVVLIAIIVLMIIFNLIDFKPGLLEYIQLISLLLVVLLIVKNWIQKHKKD